jgi:butyryl-CoA dehydrogenase
MQVFNSPLNDMKFLLKDFLNSEHLELILENNDFEISDLNLVLEQASGFCENNLLPINQSGDSEGCKFENGQVSTPSGFKEAYKEFIGNGWLGMTLAKEYGGQGLPGVLGTFVNEIVSSSNMSFGNFPGLTTNAFEAIEKSGSDKLKNLYLPKLATGEWTGTMNLTEPQCGTDLGLCKTMAQPQGNGSYKITGTKIFITAGEHDLSENIIHLVLARTPNAPIGVKGISLFLVPKIIPKSDGKLGKKNNLECGSIEDKMGIKASPTCVMHYNEAKGWLVGELYKGMDAMFVMMNGARLMVGVQSLGMAEVAYQSALYYARDRLQGRSLHGAKNPKKPADPIIVHPDVKKNLLKLKSLTEGVRGLVALTALQLDLARVEKDKFKKQMAEDWVALLTPIIKAYGSDIGSEAANLAVQIYGGHGYIKEHGVEQLVRDARITQLYEGTNGIQALDLVGRKLPMHNGRLLRSFFHVVKGYIEKNTSNSNLSDFIPALMKSFGRLQQVTTVIASKGLSDPDEGAGPATDYLKMFALTAVAYVWTRFAEISYKKQNDDPTGFYKAKIETGKFYMNKLLPETGYLMSSIMSGAKIYTEYDEAYFDTSFSYEFNEWN